MLQTIHKAANCGIIRTFKQRQAHYDKVYNDEQYTIQWTLIAKLSFRN